MTLCGLHQILNPDTEYCSLTLLPRFIAASTKERLCQLALLLIRCGNFELSQWLCTVATLVNTPEIISRTGRVHVTDSSRRAYPFGGFWPLAEGVFVKLKGASAVCRNYSGQGVEVE